MTSLALINSTPNTPLNTSYKKELTNLPLLSPVVPFFWWGRDKWLVKNNFNLYLSIQSLQWLRDCFHNALLAVSPKVLSKPLSHKKRRVNLAKKFLNFRAVSKPSRSTFRRTFNLRGRALRHPSVLWRQTYFFDRTYHMLLGSYPKKSHLYKRPYWHFFKGDRLPFRIPRPRKRLRLKLYKSFLKKTFSNLELVKKRKILNFFTAVQSLQEGPAAQRISAWRRPVMRPRVTRIHRAPYTLLSIKVLVKKDVNSLENYFTKLLRSPRRLFKKKASGMNLLTSSKRLKTINLQKLTKYNRKLIVAQRKLNSTLSLPQGPLSILKTLNVPNWTLIPYKFLRLARRRLRLFRRINRRIARARKQSKSRHLSLVHEYLTTHVRTPRTLVAYLRSAQLPSRFHISTLMRREGLTRRRPLLPRSRRSRPYRNTSGWDKQSRVLKFSPFVFQNSVKVFNLDRLFTRGWQVSSAQSLSVRFRANETLTRGLRIQPKFSRYFIRSPFFFVNKFRADPWSQRLYAPNWRHVPRGVNYLIFPESNRIKIATFRKLLRHRHFTAALSSRARFTKLRKYSRLLRFGKKLPISEMSDFTSAANPLRNTTAPLKYKLFQKNFYKKRLFSLLRIPRIRFKPGYARLWREGRRASKLLFKIFKRYQYRITPILQKIYLGARRQTHGWDYKFNVRHALIYAKFFPDMWAVEDASRANWIYLNGELCQNLEIFIFAGDFIQLVVSIQYYIASKWMWNWHKLRIARLTRVFYKRTRIPQRAIGLRKPRELPDGYEDLYLTSSRLPDVFELDYFTLSLFVVYDPHRFSYVMPTQPFILNLDYVNMYNWKYIT